MAIYLLSLNKMDSEYQTHFVQSQIPNNEDIVLSNGILTRMVKPVTLQSICILTNSREYIHIFCHSINV